MARTSHYRDLLAWQKAMEFAGTVYALTEQFPKSETFGRRMQLRRSAFSIASNIAEGHGRLTDAQLRNSLGMVRGSLYELQTQAELAGDMSLIDQQSLKQLFDLAVDVAKLVNGRLGVVES